MTPDERVELVSEAGVRFRYRVREARHRSEFCRRLESALKAIDYFDTARVNPDTGRVLLLCSDDHGSEPRVRGMLEDALEFVSGLDIDESNRSSETTEIFSLAKMAAIPLPAVVLAVGGSIVSNVLNVLPPLIFAAIAYAGVHGGLPLFEQFGITSPVLQSPMSRNCNTGEVMPNCSSGSALLSSLRCER